MRIDWNRDGREDVCISHLKNPVALLTNRTNLPGNHLAFRLVGVDSSRDAIGATIKIRIGKQTWERQLTAGDGFHASNERRLVFGLGNSEQVDSVEVTWPTGVHQKFQHFRANQEWLLVENRSHYRLDIPIIEKRISESASN